MSRVTEMKDYRMGKPRRQKPPAEGARRQVARKSIHIHDDFAYYVIRSNIKCERRVTAGLRNLGFQFYYPTFVYDMVRRGKRDRYETPALPRYLFVGLDRDLPELGAVHGIDGVESIVGVAGTPFPVPVAALRALEAECCKGAATGASVTVGQQYRITAGVFAGFFAAVEAVMPGDMVKVLVTMFGLASPVDIPAEDLEAA